MDIWDGIVEMIILIGFCVCIYAVLFGIKALKDDMRREEEERRRKEKEDERD